MNLHRRSTVGTRRCARSWRDVGVDTDPRRGADEGGDAVGTRTQTGVVPVPSQVTAYRRLAPLTKGTNAVSGFASGRRSIVERPQGVDGRLRATRPGKYLILDTQDLDVFAMEPVTCRWVKAQLTVAQDLFDRQILGLKVTPGVEQGGGCRRGVLFEAVHRLTTVAVLSWAKSKIVGKQSLSYAMLHLL